MTIIKAELALDLVMVSVHIVKVQFVQCIMLTPQPNKYHSMQENLLKETDNKNEAEKKYL